MPFNPDPGEHDPQLGSLKLPGYNTTWDRDLNIYNILEFPVLPGDGEPGSEGIPVGLVLLREFCADAAGLYSWEVWFDFSPDAGPEFIDVAWTPPGKGTQTVRLPRAILFDGDDEIGVFSKLLELADDDGVFTIHISEFRDAPGKHNPWDKRGRIVPRRTEPEDEDEVPGIVETVTIRAFRLSVKGHTAPEDFVIQICPRFWHMPSGFEVG